MALSLQLGFPDVPKSITNPYVQRKDALDVNDPLSFLTFIKIINVSFEPDSLQEYYSFYVKSWNSVNQSKNISDRSLIVEKYKDFLKDIILSYSTLEEKKFLSSIDFDDPLDLDIAIGFYSRKLRDISIFYNKKRTDIKFNTTRNKLRGTNFGTGLTIKELIVSYFKNIDDSNMLFDMNSIISNIEIEIEELYDSYPLYFDQTPNDRVYDKKDLDYGLNIFLKDDSDLISEVFGNFSENLKQIKEVDQLFENKRKLTEKYMFTDFYYLSTGDTSTNILSGKLFESSNTISNFLNRSFPTTASTQHYTNLESKQDIGFFTPSNVSIITLDGVNKGYTIDEGKLTPNTLYVFPDPSKISDNSAPLIYILDDTFLKRNSSSGKISNQPTSSKFDTKYYGYTSKIELGSEKYLDVIFNSGYILDSKKDIYGNLYGLYKSGHQKYIETIEDSNIIYNILFNGYEYYDNLYNEGLSFDYTLEDDSTYTETIRTGLSTNTNGFSTFDPDIVLKFGNFSPYHELILPTEYNLVRTIKIVEGALFTKYDNSLYPDPISSDLSAFEFSTDPFYYTVLVEGGISYDSTQRALSSPNTLSAYFTDYDRPSLYMTDGGYFGDPLYNYSPQIINNILYIPENTNNTEILPISTFDAFDGSLMIKNSSTREVLPLLEALPYLQSTYPPDLVNDLLNVNKFEIIYDNLLIESSNYFTLLKIKQKNNILIDPNKTSIYFQHSTTPYNKISNRYKSNNYVYYCIMESEGNSYDSDFKIYPNVYIFDSINYKITKIYPTNSTDLTQFNLSGNILWDMLDDPTISHNSFNNIFNLSFLLKDQNNMSKLYSMDFELDPDLNILSYKNYYLGDSSISNVFANNTTLTTFLSSSVATTMEDELIL